jgi:hypothetical protein
MAAEVQVVEEGTSWKHQECALHFSSKQYLPHPSQQGHQYQQQEQLQQEYQQHEHQQQEQHQNQQMEMVPHHLSTPNRSQCCPGA